MFINEIKMNNFMRFKGNVTVKLNKGITVIFGDNGAGKTSIIDAIFFGLYGKTYRTNGTSASGFLSIKDLINRQEKSAEVELLFTIDGKKYKIIRKISKSGSSLSYLNEGNEQIAEGKKVEEIISSKIVGFDYNSLKNSIVIMQKEISSYLTMSGAERKLSLINLFKLNEYNDYLSKAKEYAKDLKLKEEEEEFKINQYNKDLEKENDYLSQEKESEKNTEDFSQRQKQLEERLKELETKLSNILNAINESEMSIRLFNQQTSSNKNKLIDLNKSFNTIGNAQTCPLCLQEINNPQSLNEHYTEEINKVEKEIADLTEKANKENKIKNANLEEKYNIESEINKIEKEIDLIKEKSTESAVNYKMINEALKELGKVKIELKEAMRRKEEYRKEQALVSKLEDAYIQIPKRILNRIIPAIEKEASEISKILTDGFISDIKIDKETFRITPEINGDYEEIQFLSGGEQVKIAISLRIAISNIIGKMSNSPAQNTFKGLDTLIIDEGDFGSLDTAGINSLISMFSNLKQIFDNIVIITHITDLKEALAENVIRISKYGKYESRISYENGVI